MPESGGGKLVAVGYSQPSFWPQDAIAAAADDARGKLALALTSHVEVVGIDSADENGNGEATINKEATDVVLKNSRVEATWTDENGERSEPGGVWALASMQVGAAAAAHAAGASKSGPGWLDRLPGAADRVYATGYSGPTYHPEDAERYAREDAIAKLAATLRAHVQAYTLLVESAEGLAIDQFAQTIPDEEFRELVRKNAVVEATWVDREGRAGGGSARSGVGAGGDPGAIQRRGGSAGGQSGSRGRRWTRRGRGSGVAPLRSLPVWDSPRRAARSKAEIIGAGSALPFQAMSSAVPWSGLVRGKGGPG